MKKKGLLLFAAAILSGCAASGAKFSTIESSFPAVEPDSGRVYFYRTYSTFGAGMRPEIFVDGKVVGKSIPGGVFYADLSAGEHAITVDAQIYPGASLLRVNIEPKETAYVRTWIGGGGFVGRTNIAIVPESEAKAAIAELSFTGDVK
jgi:hypothetical protein